MKIERLIPQFRGKIMNPKNEQWVYGSLVIGAFGYYIYPFTTYKAKLKGFKVIPDTVSQFVDTLDVRDKKIFENDFLHTGDNEVGIVKYSDGCFFLLTKESSYIPLYNLMPQEIKVIGNIHDNPELI